ncbi:hypothetical protein [Aliidiomarina celeris]|uniref:hypothetical protein n=1 Tax=Aliidiomarina celeris TaxID=2249428 RepID=UPI0018E5F926|nr:hypothetical protein [Aliidiomarina celeris]
MAQSQMTFCVPMPKACLQAKEIGCCALQPGGWLLVECYNEQQLGRGTGGPPTAELMVSLHELEQAFSGFQMLHAENTVRSIVEGSGHNGEGAVCQFIARKL